MQAPVVARHLDHLAAEVGAGSDRTGSPHCAAIRQLRPRLPRVYRGAVLLDEPRTLFTLQALAKASDAQDVRVESTKLKDYDIES